MPKVKIKQIQETILSNDGSIKEDTSAIVEIIDEQINIIIEKSTFFSEEDEEEEWFKKQAAGEDTEDDSVDMYMIDDDKSW